MTDAHELINGLFGRCIVSHPLKDAKSPGYRNPYQRNVTTFFTYIPGCNNRVNKRAVVINSWKQLIVIIAITVF
jgi:hypothetical protein